VAGPLRRLWALIHNLPDESATYRDKTFSRMEELVTTLIELTDLGLRGEALKKAIKIPRPGAQQEAQGLSDAQKVVAFFEQMKRGGGMN